MHPMVALILPWLTFYRIGQTRAGFLSLLLQLTMLGWPPAALAALYALARYRAQRRIQEMLMHRW
jgi:uncharacterized membrane protein YqaE (UPF0057 family)